MDLRGGARVDDPIAMPYGLYISAAGADAQSRRIEVLTNNLANTDTPGFKRELAVLQARYSEAIERGEQSPGTGAVEDVGGGVRVRETVTSFEHGPLERTGIPTDMAIADGDGFFVVDHHGQQLLTRAGNFRLASDGRLITQQGYSVLDDDGTSITIDPSLPWRVDEDGKIHQGGSSVALGVKKPESLGDLVRVGENLFSPLAPASSVPVGDRQIVGGYLERSTVRPTREMMQLIEASRAYEANVRLIQSQDQMLGSLVNRVLRQV